MAMAENSKKQPDELSKIRHSLAHILAYAVKDLYKDVKFGVGPVIENGFFYDFDLEQTISEDDLPKIEKRMREIIKHDYKFEREEISLKEAREQAKKQGQPYKVELIDDITTKGSTDVNAQLGGGGKVDKVSFYTIGEFSDLCRGGHVESTGKVGAFKLTRVSGAYWRGNEKNPQMQRIYGVAFAEEKELKTHLELLEEAKKRDHRKLGQELDLYASSGLVGSGLPLFTPRGTVLRHNLASYSQELQSQYGFERVWTPHIAKEELYKVSGHWDKFGDELFLVKSQETHDQLVMKPMNCPHHIQLFARRPWSYRQLPIRYMENTTNYRDEKSGELHGLARVRSLSQDDGHVFCKEDDIEQELVSICRMVKDMYTALYMEFYARLSYRDDSEAYLGDKKLWAKAEKLLAKVAKEERLEYVEETGEAAFYGPKIDFMVKDSLGREWQCATIQLDFVLPERFGLVFTDSNGSEKRPVMIHKALLGSIERFLSVYIEHTGGKFPVWLAPEQIRIATVNDEEPTINFAKKLLAQARELGLRVGLDESNESVGKKIRSAEVMKVPYVIVIGDKEVKSGRLTPRIRSDMEVVTQDKSHGAQEFLKTVANEAKSRVNKTSL